MNEKKNILVVDDNQINLQVVSSYLQESNYNVILALNGESALQILETTDINLILMDIMMPKMDGFETTRRIKENEQFKEIPVIFLTAKTQPKDIVNGFKAGSVDYITKPFNGDELKIRVKNHLDLSEAKRTILQHQKTRDRLFSILAHDIRSPLASISMLLDGISEKYIDVTGPNFDKLIHDISINTKDTLILIQNILEWIKNQNNIINVVPENIPIQEIINHCIEVLSLHLIEKQIDLTCDIPEYLQIYADEATTKNIFRNVLSNAIKFTHNKGKITISCSESKKLIDIIITDSGVGMSPLIVEKIFKKDGHFTSKGTNNEKGTGLGLYMVKDFVKLNKGTIRVESEIQKGTTICISLPRAIT